jgi:hypothetical protein
MESVNVHFVPTMHRMHARGSEEKKGPELLSDFVSSFNQQLFTAGHMCHMLDTLVGFRAAARSKTDMFCPLWGLH